MAATFGTVERCFAARVLSVLDDAPVNGPERGNDRVIGAVDEVLSLRGLSAGEIGHVFGFDHVPGDTKGDLAVDPSVAVGLLRQTSLDPLGLGSWSGETKEMIVHVTGVTKPPIMRIIR
ncbi:hypothetical protein [Streptomyces sp. NPDC048277]|uniref:hypothetical protein n=1 Tax=Streptomyces sp. NPDC048277 TaxID=3155027 RepID=UPI003407545C